MNEKVGISDIGLYVPSNAMDVAYLAAMRAREQPELGPHLQRAIETTGQRRLRFPCPWEDTATMAAEAARRVILASSSLDLAALRYLVAGTESGLDHAKPVSAYVQGMLRQTGLPVGTSHSSFQVQHACAGGTLGMLSVAAMLQVGAVPGEFGVVTCSDVARYASHSTAEITQGAGAAALLVESAPRLLELDVGTAGLYSADVDDFFRPLGSVVARVKGAYSLKCYAESLEGALLDHSRRRGVDPSEVLESADLLVLHTPFRNLPELVSLRLLSRILGLGPEAGREFLNRRGLDTATAPVAVLGNTYTASLYFCLASLLAGRYREEGDAIVGRSVLMASYGSGNTMVVASGRIAAGAPGVIRSWRHEGQLGAQGEAGWEEYCRWMDRGSDANGTEVAESPNSHPNCYFLRRVRPDGYREYGYRAPGGSAPSRHAGGELVAARGEAALTAPEGRSTT
jgi:hydroxymethylglutaryl-CoA synthase